MKNHETSLEITGPNQNITQTDQDRFMKELKELLTKQHLQTDQDRFMKELKELITKQEARIQHLQTDQDRFKELKELITKQEARIQYLQGNAFQLANYFFVFQGVIFAAIANASSLTCSDTWFIFLPSFVAAIITVVALFTTSLSYIRSKELIDETWSECNELANRLSVRGPGRTQLRDLFKKMSGIAISDRDAIKIRYTLVIGSMVLFLVFAGGMLSGPWFVICKHDKSRRHF